MRFDPRPAVISERRASAAEAAAQAMTWKIVFDVPAHPGMSHGAHLFRYYSGLDVTVTRGDAPDTLRVNATGGGAQLRRLLEWTDDLYRRMDVRLVDAFAGERFMEATARPGREIA